MLLSITSTQAPATDLGFLLHKHPERVQDFSLAFGRAHVFYPEATEERCTAALLLELDPVSLVRGKGGGSSGLLDQYVNDRPYASSSFLSVAISRVLGSALAGRCDRRPQLVDQAQNLEARLTALPCRGGEPLLRRLFEPLGYTVQATAEPLDERFPEWGAGRHWNVGLVGNQTLSDLLSHLYVLVPVLDDDKHYYVDQDEVEKLLRHGKDWLAEHPEKEIITQRYLVHQRRLAREALARLSEDSQDPALEEERQGHQEAALEKTLSLNQVRMAQVRDLLVEKNAQSVLDLGCGEGKLLQALLPKNQFSRLAGCDVSPFALNRARKRLRMDDPIPPRRVEDIELFQGSGTYRDERFQGFDAICLIEVLEHLELERLPALERVLFEFAQPRFVVLTTPNAEYNALFETLSSGKFRHKDHRFEWTRQEFENWANTIAQHHGYTVSFQPVGPVHETLGAPTQMAVLEKASKS